MQPRWSTRKAHKRHELLYIPLQISKELVEHDFGRSWWATFSTIRGYVHGHAIALLVPQATQMTCTLVKQVCFNSHSSTDINGHFESFQPRQSVLCQACDAASDDLQQRFETNASHAETCQHIPPLSSISLCLMWIERQSLCILDMSCKPYSH